MCRLNSTLVFFTFKEMAFLFFEALPSQESNLLGMGAVMKNKNFPQSKNKLRKRM